MNTDRFVISDHIWEQIEPVLSGKSSDCGVTGKDNRLFLEAVLWRVRTGTPWR
ncbi:transposase, partial [Terasakiella brassicae]